MSAGCPALYILIQNRFFVHSTVKKSVIDVIEAETCDGVGKAFTGLTLIPEEKDGLFNHIHHLFLAGQDAGKGKAMGNLLAPASANVDPVSGNVLGCDTEGTPALTSGTVVTLIGTDAEFTVHKLRDLDGTAVHDLTGAAAAAL